MRLSQVCQLFKLLLQKQTRIQMKQTSKDKIINESIAIKLATARQLRVQQKYEEALKMYRKVLFLRQDPEYIAQMASIYQSIKDLTSAVGFYKRANQLKQKAQYKQKIKQLTKIQGSQLLQAGSVNNILVDTQFESFIKRYPIFQKKMVQKAKQKHAYKDHLYNCLAYLEVNHRQFALDEIENCIKIDDKEVEFIVLRALIYWSVMDEAKGYNQFWQAYKIDKKNYDVVLFLQMINPKVQQAYKDAKYLLIEKKISKCKICVKSALQMYPCHTELLILNAYLHRVSQQYEDALNSLQLANKTLQNHNLEADLRNQISLTYNEMGIYLFKQGKFEEAITLFTEGLSFKPDDWGMLANRGDCHKALNDYIKALQDYLNAFKDAKKNEDLGFRISAIYNTRGITMFNSRSFQLACSQFQQAIKYYPKCAQFYLSLAKCQLQLGKKKQGLENLQEAAKINPGIEQVKTLLQQNKEAEGRVKNTRKIIALNKEKS